jgi:hypothetical protein
VGGFKRTRSGASISLNPVEVAVLRQVMDEMAELVGGGEAAADAQEWARELGLSGLGDDSEIAPGAPTDPVQARLFPAGYRDDAGAADEFRRFTEPDLRTAKAANARAMRESLPEAGGTVRLDQDGTTAWLGALNDARLALGTALDVDENTEYELAKLEANEPRAQRLLVYHWLGQLQDSLLATLMRD